MEAIMLVPVESMIGDEETDVLSRVTFVLCPFYSSSGRVSHYVLRAVERPSIVLAVCDYIEDALAWAEENDVSLSIVC